jgi:hypothetical protein
MDRAKSMENSVFAVKNILIWQGKYCITYAKEFLLL